MAKGQQPVPASCDDSTWKELGSLGAEAARQGMTFSRHRKICRSASVCMKNAITIILERVALRPSSLSAPSTRRLNPVFNLGLYAFTRSSCNFVLCAVVGIGAAFQQLGSMAKTDGLIEAW